VIIPGDSIYTFNQILSVIGNIAVVALSMIALIVAVRPK
jgi:hypothetical protein